MSVDYESQAPDGWSYMKVSNLVHRYQLSADSEFVERHPNGIREDDSVVRIDIREVNGGYSVELRIGDEAQDDIESIRFVENLPEAFDEAEMLSEITKGVAVSNLGVYSDTVTPAPETDPHDY